MNRTELLLLLMVVSCLILGKMQINALKCYVCKGCDLSYNETHLTNCPTEDEEEAKIRCVKREMIDGEVERDCGAVDDCKVSNKDDKKIRTSGSEAYTNRGRKPRRFVRQLLQTSAKKEDNSNITTEFTSLSCCKEDECNGAFSQLIVTKSTYPIPLLAIVICHVLLFFDNIFGCEPFSVLS